MANIYTEQQLNQICSAYQEILGIQDWRVEVVLVDQRDLEDEYQNPLHGQVAMFHKKQYARIQIPTAETYQRGFEELDQDMHYTLLHEIIHILFSEIHPDQLNPDVRDKHTPYKLFELAIHKLARALQELLPPPSFPPEQSDEQ